MSWAKFDDGYDDNAKIVRAGRDAKDLHQASIRHCCRHLTDGKVEREFLPSLMVKAGLFGMDPIAMANQMVAKRLFDYRDGEYWVHDFLEFNPSREEALHEKQHLSEVRSQAGRKGALARWGNRTEDSEADSKTDGKPDFCHSKKMAPYPESRIPESRIPIPDAPPNGGKRGGRAKGSAPAVAPTSATWDAYSEAYLSRYGNEPICNAKVRGQLAQFVKRVPADDAPLVARFFLKLNQRWYIENRHSVGCLLMHAEKVHSEWRAGRGITSREATEADRLQGQGQVWADVRESFRGQTK